MRLKFQRGCTEVQSNITELALLHCVMCEGVSSLYQYTQSLCMHVSECIIPSPSFPCSRWQCPPCYSCMEQLTSDAFSWVFSSGTGQKYIQVDVHVYLYTFTYILVKSSS